jgi:cysteinyl-tRNA synthetase
LILDFEKNECTVSGVSSVSLVRECNPEIYAAGKTFPLNELGNFKQPASLEIGISSVAWELANNAAPAVDESPDADVLSLLDARQEARLAKDWSASDRLRDEILALGWTVTDTTDGPTLARSSKRP